MLFISSTCYLVYLYIKKCWATAILLSRIFWPVLATQEGEVGHINNGLSWQKERSTFCWFVGNKQLQYNRNKIQCKVTKKVYLIYNLRPHLDKICRPLDTQFRVKINSSLKKIWLAKPNLTSRALTTTYCR